MGHVQLPAAGCRLPARPRVRAPSEPQCLNTTAGSEKPQLPVPALEPGKDSSPPPPNQMHHFSAAWHSAFVFALRPGAQAVVLMKTKIISAGQRSLFDIPPVWSKIENGIYDED